MAITAFDDISNLVDYWLADDATVTTGTDVDDIVGGDGNYDVDDPSTYESTPNYNSSGAPAGDAIVEFDTTRGRLQCDTNLNITGDCTIVYAYQVHDDSSGYILWHGGGFELLEVGTYDNGADIVNYFECGFSQILEGPAVVNDDWVILVVVKDAGTDTVAYWNSRSTTDSSSTTSENILAFTLGNYTAGNGNGNSSHKVLAIYDKVCSDSEVDDLFDYVDELVNGSSGETIEATSYDASASFAAATVSPGAVTVTGNGFDASATVTNPSVSHDVAGTSLDAGASFGAPTVGVGAVDIAGNGHDASTSFASATITTGAVNIGATSADVSATFASATVSPGAADIAGSGHDASATFGAPDITATGSIAATSLDASASFALATVSAAQDISAVSLDASASFGTATVSPGAVSIAAVSLDASASIALATVAPGSVDVTGSGHDASASFAAATIAPGSVSIGATAVDASASFANATITTGAVNVAGNGYDAAASFGTATVAPGAVNVGATSLDASPSFGSSSVTSTFAIVAAAASFAVTFGLASIQSTLPIVATSLDASVTFGAPVIGGGVLSGGWLLVEVQSATLDIDYILPQLAISVETATLLVTVEPG